MLDSGATISECGKFRYRLWRLWDETLPECCFLMLNPSTADHLKDDPTIKRCIGFAKREGCGRLDVVNLFAFRATDPRELMEVADPVGPGNDDAIADATRFAEIIIAAWGVNGTMQARKVEAQLQEFRKGRVKCLGKTKAGHPMHPLYRPNDTPLEAYL
jgi:hypothetical protein